MASILLIPGDSGSATTFLQVSMVPTTDTRATPESFDNRRKFPRLKMHLHAVLVAPGGHRHQVTILNISPDGAQLSCAVEDAAYLQAAGGEAREQAPSPDYTLRFDLAYGEFVSRITIGARVVYIRHNARQDCNCGIFFTEQDLAENKKISDFLFWQLQSSFAEIEYLPEIAGDEKSPAIKTYSAMIETRARDAEDGHIQRISDEVDELILQMGLTHNQMEPLKQLLFRILSNLKVIQEYSRHIDERIRNLEYKLSKRS